MNEVLPKPNPQVLFTELEDGTGVLLHLDTKFYYTLNRTGVSVWKALVDASAADLIALAQRIAVEFDVELTAARSDVEGFLQDMLADHLVLPKTA